MDDDQQFCLRWNNHQSTLVSVFDTLLEKGIHVDCTLAAEGQTLKAHKVVLSACSPYFESVLSQQYDKHPIIILKDVKYAELRAMMDYMYRGEVNISQDQLAALLKAAESLQIKGLSDNKPSRPPSRPAQPPPPAQLAPPPSPPPETHSQKRDSSADSREGSASPSRRRKKARKLSSESAAVAPLVAAAPLVAVAPPLDGAPLAPVPADQPVKDETSREADDLTLDEEADDHTDVVRNFQWHMERSQDELMNSSDSVRESQEPLPSALLSLLSQSQSLASLVPSCIHLTSRALTRGQHQHQHQHEEADSDEYDDTDDIVLPDEADEEGGALVKEEEGGEGPKAERSFECRHCGKRYRWKSTLRRHENVECGGKPPAHQCPYCCYRAKQRGNLGVHIRKHHNAHWFQYATTRVRKPKKLSLSPSPVPH